MAGLHEQGAGEGQTGRAHAHLPEGPRPSPAHGDALTPASGRPKGRHIWAAAGLALLVAFIGGAVTDLGPWYQALRQPPWKPPDWLFPPAWSIIFGLCAWSGALAWARSRNRIYRRWIIGLFGLNAACNIGWSLLFFQLKRPDIAMIGVVALWLSIVFLIAFLGQRSKLAALLLTPYLVWVTFAGALNAAVVGLNGPF